MFRHAHRRSVEMFSMRSVSALADLPAFRTPSIRMGLLLAATGLFVWIGLSIWAGMAASEGGFRLREGWDSSAYFYFGIPIMALAVLAAAFRRPIRAWRWPLWLVGGHQIGVMLLGLGMQSGLSLIILTAILAILLAALFAIPALLGATVARALVERMQ